MLVVEQEQGTRGVTRAHFFGPSSLLRTEAVAQRCSVRGLRDYFGMPQNFIESRREQGFLLPRTCGTGCRRIIWRGS